MADTYRIVRHYQDPSKERTIVRTGLTVQQAQLHCQDPETSSSTCTTPTAVQRTRRYGAWFDSYAAE